MEHESIAIIGFGDLGRRVSARLPSHWRGIGLRRRVSEVPAGVRAIAADLADPASLACLERIAPAALLVTLSPGERSVAGYRAGFATAMDNILAGLGGHRPRRAFFVSSTRVYAEKAGAWVDEDSELAVDDPHARAIIDAEARFLEVLPGATVLRAAGLYGHGPGPLLRAVAAGSLRPAAPPVFGNRIHRDDVAGFIVHALESGAGSPIVNLVDDACVALQDIEAWLCEALRRPYDPPADGPGAGAGELNHKRVRNGRLHASGYALAYPDFRSGYADVLRQWVAHSEREDGLDLH